MVWHLRAVFNGLMNVNVNKSQQSLLECSAILALSISNNKQPKSVRPQDSTLKDIPSAGSGAALAQDYAFLLQNVQVATYGNFCHIFLSR